jgi:Ca2+-binding EF-hand superfamily protein
MQADPTTEVRIVSPKPDPWDELARIYFDIVRLLKALDADGDRIISAWEIVTAASPLRRLDRNGDGELDAEECGFVWDKDVDPTITNRARMQFMQVHPVLGALDADRDGRISLEEIEGASIALRGLDKNGDGSLSPAEVLPERIDGRATTILSRLDKDPDRRLSAQEKANEEAGPLRSLLDSADRNGDGIVTAAELTTELQLRDQTKKIEEAAKGFHGMLDSKRK